MKGVFDDFAAAAAAVVTDCRRHVMKRSKTSADKLQKIRGKCQLRSRTLPGKDIAGAQRYR